MASSETPSESKKEEGEKTKQKTKGRRRGIIIKALAKRDRRGGKRAASGAEL